MSDAKAETSNRNEMGHLTKVVSEWGGEYNKKTDIEILEEGKQAIYQFTADASGDFTFDCFVEVYEETSRVDVYLYAAILISEKKRHEVADLLSRANFGLSFGKITMSSETGKLRFEGTLGVEGGVLSTLMINNMVDGGIGIMDHYMPAVMAVAHAHVTPAAAYDNVQGESKTTAAPDAIDTSQAWGWDRFMGAAPLKTWAEDITKSINSEVSKDDWAVTGRAIVLINEDDSYSCEALKRVAADSGMKFVKIPVDEVMNMPDSSAFRSLAPVLVYLAPGDRGSWMSGEKNEDADEAERVEQFQYRLIDSLRDFNPKRPVIFAVSVYQLEEVSTKLRRVGLFERFIAIPRRSLEILAQDFLSEYGYEHCDDSLKNEMGKVGQLLKSDFNGSEQRDLAMLALRRIQSKQNRKIGFIDLVHISTHSLIEEAQPQSMDENDRKRVAYHEAGHAVIAILESNGEAIPDYTSIVPGASFDGIMVGSYKYRFSIGDSLTSYEDFRRGIRVSLGGRVAEEVAYGSEKVGSGASSDLEYATKRTFRAFSRWGFAPSMQAGGSAESNLAVVSDKLYASEYIVVAGLVREFLAEEYRVVRKTLTENRELLDQVAERLLWDPIVDQDELSELYEAYKSKKK